MWSQLSDSSNNLAEHYRDVKGLLVSGERDRRYQIAQFRRLKALGILRVRSHPQQRVDLRHRQSKYGGSNAFETYEAKAMFPIRSLELLEL
ncbi:hypothetical protein [Bradyrhizobium sp. USDA 4452]